MCRINISTTESTLIREKGKKELRDYWREWHHCGATIVWLEKNILFGSLILRENPRIRVHCNQLGYYFYFILFFLRVESIFIVLKLSVVSHNCGPWVNQNRIVGTCLKNPFTWRTLLLFFNIYMKDSNKENPYNPYERDKNKRTPWKKPPFPILNPKMA